MLPLPNLLITVICIIEMLEMKYCIAITMHIRSTTIAHKRGSYLATTIK